MNKYKEAWGFLIGVGKYGVTKFTVDEWGESLDLIQELVDKATPKKVIVPETPLEQYYHQESCPNCKTEFGLKVAGYRFRQAIRGDVKYCPQCGQALDWSDE